MTRGSIGAGWMALFLIAACGGGDQRASGPPGAPAKAAASPASGSASSAEPRELPLTVDNAKQLVRDLITAFQEGDRAKVEALWARDGGTWRDQAGFDARASYYRVMAFELDSEKIETVERGRAIAVVVHAKKDGAPWDWTFLVNEIGGALRAGGAESHPAGLP